MRSRDTKPEWIVRRLVHGMGYRYRLHDKKLPGCPDLVLRSRKKLIFVHGCFWHRHGDCHLARLPKSRQEFWIPKLQSNRDRDRRNQKKLRAGGWQVLVVWECQLKDRERLAETLKAYLES